MSAQDADAVRTFAEQIADYMTTRNTPWRDEALMREAVYEAVRLVFGDARYEARQLLNDGTEPRKDTS